MSATLQEYLESQEELLREASEALPHQFNQCTYLLGSLRQPVYLCVTCNTPRGICSACSIACHTDHEQIELFPKRDFRCDCPTSALAHPCQLHKQPEDPNTSNNYGQNFTGLFCRCHRPYDPDTERETMIQCLACEDWFHESCCNLRDKPEPEFESEAKPTSPPSEAPPEADVDDGVSDTSSSGLPPPLIRADDYDSLVCASCVRKIPILQRYVGTPGCLFVVRDAPNDPWKVLSPSDSNINDSPVTVTDDSTPTGAAVPSKRPSSTCLDEREAKKARPICLAPAINPTAQKVLGSETRELGAGDMFLTEDFRDRWCRCENCLPCLEANPFLLKEEETYEPPKDPDSGLSLEELGMRALNRIPRERAIDGIHAFNAMRDNLVNYLRPFASEGKVVGDEDVKMFFDTLKQGASK